MSIKPLISMMKIERKRKTKEGIFSAQRCKNNSDAHEGVADICGEGRK